MLSQNNKHGINSKYIKILIGPRRHCCNNAVLKEIRMSLILVFTRPLIDNYRRQCRITRDFSTTCTLYNLFN